MIKYIFTILLSVIALTNCAQFNIIVDDTTNNHLYIQTFNDSNYIIQSGSSVSGGNRGLCYTKLNYSQQVEWKKIYSGSVNWYEGYKQSTIKAGNIYISLLNKVKNYYEPNLLILDNNFDTVQTKLLINDTLNISFYSIINIALIDRNI